MNNETITTRSVGRGFAEVNEAFVLEDKPRTRTVFQAQIHSGGVRGQLIRYRKGNNNTEEIVPVNFNQLHENDGVKIELGTEAVKKLDEAVGKLTQLLHDQGVQYGEHQFSINTAGALVITDENKAAVIRGLLDQDLSEDVWLQIAETNPSLASRLAAARLQEDRKVVLEQFETMLIDTSLTEGNWQDFFEQNTWIFGYGLRYQILKVLEAQPNYGGTAVSGRGGQRGDFLATTEAEVKMTCLVEIKKPSSSLLQSSQYRNGVWGVSDELSGAIAQIQINSATWEIEGSRTQANTEDITQNQSVYTIQPKGIVVIGKLSQVIDRDKRNSFERYRGSLHNPEVITYDELYERAKYIVEGEITEARQEGSSTNLDSIDW